MGRPIGLGWVVDEGSGNEIGWETCLNLGLGLGMLVIGTLGLFVLWYLLPWASMT